MEFYKCAFRPRKETMLEYLVPAAYQSLKAISGCQTGRATVENVRHLTHFLFVQKVFVDVSRSVSLPIRQPESDLRFLPEARAPFDLAQGQDLSNL